MQRIEKMELIQTIDNVNIEEKCRACFEKCGEYKMLFENAENIANRSLGDVFFDIVKIEATHDAESSLPNRICLPCSKDLISAYNFIQKSHQSNNRFLDYLKGSNMKPSDCLSEFPIDIPNEPASSDFLQIKVEDEIMNEYPYPQEDQMFASSCSNSESDDEPLLHKKGKINKMQCTYCGRIFKRLDFLENHKKKHEEEIMNKNEGESADGDLKVLCDDCGLSFTSKVELKNHRIANHPARTQKHTSVQQFAALVDFLKDNSGLAKGILNAPEYKAQSLELWDGITNILNGLGPPIKTRDGWKKVWKDFKYHIKTKLRQSHKAIHGKEGGPSKQYGFSPLEEDVIVLLGLRTQESGLQVRKFGVPFVKPENNESRNQPLIEKNDQFRRSLSPQTRTLIVKSENLLPCQEGSENENDSKELKQTQVQENMPAYEEKKPTPSKCPLTTTKKLLEQQKIYQEKSVQLLEEQNQLLEKQYRELKVQSEEMKKIRRIKEEKVILLKRNNEQMLRESVENRKLKMIELEIKRKKLDLQEMKLN